MSMTKIDREYADTRRTLAAFICFLVATLCFEAITSPHGDLLMRAVGAIHGTWLYGAAGSLLVALGLTFPIINVLRSMGKVR